jgi:regulator of protease activity HflC (stomatin/prohibitin superfamily)
MNKNETIAKGILVILVFIAGLLSGWFVWPEEKIIERVTEVEKVVELPATHQNIYQFCAADARRTLYSEWDGDPKEGTTPQSTKEFIDECFSKLTN